MNQNSDPNSDTDYFLKPYLNQVESHSYLIPLFKERPGQDAPKNKKQAYNKENKKNNRNIYTQPLKVC